MGSSENYQPLFIKYADRNLLTVKNIKVDDLYKKIIGKKKSGLEPPKELETSDPVAKLQLLFYLETTWNHLWNKYQYMTEWWEPLNLKMQNDKPFDNSDYSITKQKVMQSK